MARTSYIKDSDLSGFNVDSSNSNRPAPSLADFLAQNPNVSLVPKPPPLSPPLTEPPPRRQDVGNRTAASDPRGSFFDPSMDPSNLPIQPYEARPQPPDVQEGSVIGAIVQGGVDPLRAVVQGTADLVANIAEDNDKGLEYTEIFISPDAGKDTVDRARALFGEGVHLRRTAVDVDLFNRVAEGKQRGIADVIEHGYDASISGRVTYQKEDITERGLAPERVVNNATDIIKIEVNRVTGRNTRTTYAAGGSTDMYQFDGPEPRVTEGDKTAIYLRDFSNNVGDRHNDGWLSPSSSEGLFTYNPDSTLQGVAHLFGQVATQGGVGMATGMGGIFITTASQKYGEGKADFKQTAEHYNNLLAQEAAGNLGELGQNELAVLHRSMSPYDYDGDGVIGENDISAAARKIGVASMAATPLAFASEMFVLGKLTNGLIGGTIGTAKDVLMKKGVDVIKLAAPEVATEVAEQYVQNLIANTFAGYDPDRPMTQGLADVFTVTGIGMAILGGARVGANVIKGDPDVLLHQLADYLGEHSTGEADLLAMNSATPDPNRDEYHQIAAGDNVETTSGGMLHGVQTKAESDTGEGIGKEAVNKAIKKLVKKLPKGFRVVVHDDFDLDRAEGEVTDLFARQELKGQKDKGQKIKGAWDKSNTVYINASNITSAESAQGIFRHEAFTHFGTEVAMGRNTQLSRKFHNYIIQKYKGTPRWQRLKEVYAGATDHTIAREFLANMSESPKAFKNTTITDVANLIRDTMGIKRSETEGEMSDAVLLKSLHLGKRMVETGQGTHHRVQFERERNKRNIKILKQVKADYEAIGLPSIEIENGIADLQSYGEALSYAKEHPNFPDDYTGWKNLSQSQKFSLYEAAQSYLERDATDPAEVLDELEDMNHRQVMKFYNEEVTNKEDAAKLEADMELSEYQPLLNEMKLLLEGMDDVDAYIQESRRLKGEEPLPVGRTAPRSQADRNLTIEERDRLSEIMEKMLAFQTHYPEKMQHFQDEFMKAIPHAQIAEYFDILASAEGKPMKDFKSSSHEWMGNLYTYRQKMREVAKRMWRLRQLTKKPIRTEADKQLIADDQAALDEEFLLMGRLGQDIYQEVRKLVDPDQALSVKAALQLWEDPADFKRDMWRAMHTEGYLTQRSAGKRGAGMYMERDSDAPLWPYEVQEVGVHTKKDKEHNKKVQEQLNELLVRSEELRDKETEKELATISIRETELEGTLPSDLHERMRQVAVDRHALQLAGDLEGVAAKDAEMAHLWGEAPQSHQAVWTALQDEKQSILEGKVKDELGRVFSDPLAVATLEEEMRAVRGLLVQPDSSALGMTYPNLPFKPRTKADVIADIDHAWKEGHSPNSNISELLIEELEYFGGERPMFLGTSDGGDGGYMFAKARHGGSSDPYTTGEGFKESSIMSGTGAVVQGWGLYFADLLGVAKHYRNLSRQKGGVNEVTLDGKVINPTVFIAKKGPLSDDYDPKDEALIRILGITSGQIPRQGMGPPPPPDTAKKWEITKLNKEIRQLEGRVFDAEALGKWTGYLRTQIENAKAELAAMEAFDPSRIKVEKGKDPSAIYEVDLAPKAHEYLHWDKPLKEQSAFVKKIIRPLVQQVVDYKNERSKGGTIKIEGVIHPLDPVSVQQYMHRSSGSDFYADLSHTLANIGLIGQGATSYANTEQMKVASKALLAAGVRGNRYWDNKSRGETGRIVSFEGIPVDPPSQLVELLADKELADKVDRERMIQLEGDESDVRFTDEEQVQIYAIEELFSYLGSHPPQKARHELVKGAKKTLRHEKDVLRDKERFIEKFVKDFTESEGKPSSKQYLDSHKRARDAHRETIKEFQKLVAFINGLDLSKVTSKAPKKTHNYVIFDEGDVTIKGGETGGMEFAKVRAKGEGEIGAVKKSKFFDTLIKHPHIHETVKHGLTEMYHVHPNDEALERAASILWMVDKDGVLTERFEGKTFNQIKMELAKLDTKQVIVSAVGLMHLLRGTARMDKAEEAGKPANELEALASNEIQQAEEVNEHFTDVGRGVQIVNAFKYMSPYALQAYARKQISDRINDLLKKKGLNGEIELEDGSVVGGTPSDVHELVKEILAKSAENAPRTKEVVNYLERIEEMMGIGAPTFWGQYKEDIAKKVTSKIIRVFELGKKTEAGDPPMPPPVDHLIKELWAEIENDPSRPVEESIELEIELDSSKSKLAFLQTMMKNSSKFQEVWHKVAERIRSQYAHQPEVMRKMEAVFGRITYDHVQERVIMGVASESLAGMQMGLKNLILKHAAVRNSEIGILVEGVMNQLKLTRKEAAAVTDVLLKSYKKIISDEMKSELDRRVKRSRGSAKKTYKNSMTRLLEIANMGGLQREDVYNALAGGLGLPQGYDERFTHLIDRLAKNVQEAPHGFQKENAYLELMSAIQRQAGDSFWDIAMELRRAGLLTGYSTQLVNLFSTMVNWMGNHVTNTLAHTLRGDLIGGAALWGETAKGLLWSMPEVWSITTTGKGRKGWAQKKFQADPIIDRWKPKGWKKVFWPSQQLGKFAYRGLASVDVMFRMSAFEMKSYSIARRMAGGDKGKMKALLQPISMKDAKAKAQKEGLTGVNRLRRTHEIILQKRAEASPEMDEAARMFSAAVVFQQEPDGLLGGFARLWNRGAHPHKEVAGEPLAGGKMARKVVMNLAVPFVNTLVNITNTSLEWGVLGFGYNKGIWKKKEGVSKYQYEDHFYRANAGVALWAAVAYKLLADEEEDDESWFDITANGPQSSGARATLKGTDWEPYTFRVGGKSGKSWNYKETAFAPILFALGTIMDERKYGDGKISNWEQVGFAAMAYGKMTADQHFFKSLVDFMRPIYEEDRDMAYRQWETLLLKIPSSFVFPNLAFQLDRLSDPTQTGRNQLTRTWLEAIPFARRLNSPDIDIFGRPIMRTHGSIGEDMLDRIIRSTSDHDPLIELFVEKGYIPTPWQSNVELFPIFDRGKRTPSDEDEERYYISVVAGRAFRENLERWGTEDGSRDAEVTAAHLRKSTNDDEFKTIISTVREAALKQAKVAAADLLFDDEGSYMGHGKIKKFNEKVRLDRKVNP